MQINFDCSTFFIRDSRLLVDAFNVDPLYLKHDKQGQVPDYRVSFVIHSVTLTRLSALFALLALVTNCPQPIDNHIRNSTGKFHSAGEFDSRALARQTSVSSPNNKVSLAANLLAMKQLCRPLAAH